MLTVVNDDAATRDGSLIDEIVREGARRMLAAALEAEVNQYIAELAAETDERGCRVAQMGKDVLTVPRNTVEAKASEGSRDVRGPAASVPSQSAPGDRTASGRGGH